MQIKDLPEDGSLSNFQEFDPSELLNDTVGVEQGSDLPHRHGLRRRSKRLHGPLGKRFKPREQSKIQQLMKISGMEEIINKQIGQMRNQNTAISQKMIDSLRVQFPELPEEFFSDAQQEMKSFIHTLERVIDASKLTEQYGRYYSKYVTEEEISQLISFYKSPLGIKSIEANKNASLEWTNGFLLNFQHTMQKETQFYFQRMSSIAEKYTKNP